jgi:GR25 family glycosyltransferase involved in LPS biosynthesis
MKYYLIHGVDASRKEFMLDQFAAYGIDNNDVTWLCHPNKNEIEDHMIPGYTTKMDLSKGQISCTIKHYLALKDIVEKGYPYAVIMEDNLCFKGNVPERLEQYLKQLPPDWDTLFDSDWTTYIEGPVTPDCLVYKKSNEKTEQCHGGSKLANFILVSAKGAKTMYEHFLPFNHVSDWYYNYLLKTYNMNSYWAEPANTHHILRPSTW